MFNSSGHHSPGEAMIGGLYLVPGLCQTEQLSTVQRHDGDDSCLRVKRGHMIILDQNDI